MVCRLPLFVRGGCQTVIKRTRSFAEFVRSFAEAKYSVRDTRRIGSQGAPGRLGS